MTSEQAVLKKKIEVSKGEYTMAQHTQHIATNAEDYSDIFWDYEEECWYEEEDWQNLVDDTEDEA